MAGYAEVTNLIQGHLETNWLSTPVIYENVEPLNYSDPSRPKLSDGQLPYIDTKLRFSDSAVAAVGAGSPVRAWGYLEVRFYSKTKTGTSSNQSNIDIMNGLFEYSQLSYITFKESTNLTSFSEEGWYVTPIMIRFYFNR